MKAKFILLLMSLFILMFYPVTEVIEIDKTLVTSIKPVAGTINGHIVGTEVSCAYWLEYNKQPNVAVYKVASPLLLRYLGYVYYARMVRFSND